MTSANSFDPDPGQIQAVWHSDHVPERIFWKKSADMSFYSDMVECLPVDPAIQVDSHPEEQMCCLSLGYLSN